MERVAAGSTWRCLREPCTARGGADRRTGTALAARVRSVSIPELDRAGTPCLDEKTEWFYFLA